MNDVGQDVLTSQSKEDEVLSQAYELFTKTPMPDWITFFREMFGINGVIRCIFRTPEELARFETTDQYNEVLLLLTRLRERRVGIEDPKEPQRVITIRIPRSVHEWIRVEAHEHQTSMNKFCVSKLLQQINNKLIPKEQWQGKSPPATTKEPG